MKKPRLRGRLKAEQERAETLQSMLTNERAENSTLRAKIRDLEALFDPHSIVTFVTTLGKTPEETTVGTISRSETDEEVLERLRKLIRRD